MDIKSILSCFCSSENRKYFINLMFRGFNFERFCEIKCRFKRTGICAGNPLNNFEMKSDDKIFFGIRFDKMMQLWG